MQVVTMILQIILTVCAIGLVVVVLMQSSKTSGLGAAFASETGMAHGAKGRAASKEAKLQKITKVLAIVIGALAVVMVVLSGF